MKPNTLFCLSLLGLAALPAGAQNTPFGEANSPSVPEVASRIPPAVVSLTTHLQMQRGQIEELNRFYEDYASRREKQDATIAQKQDQLHQAQAPTSFDAGKAGRLSDDINAARQKVVRDLLAAHFKALKELTPVQRSQLEALANEERIRVPADKYYQLLLMPVDDLWQVPLDNRASQGQYRASQGRYAERNPRQRRERRSASRRASSGGSYGVYGGYGYGGPNYGVYGNYGQGSIGVHAGIGRGGPSIGIGVGRVFGGLFGGRRRGY